MQGLIGVFSLRSQIAAQERRNSTERKEFSFKITELRSKNEELEDNYAELV